MFWRERLRRFVVVILMGSEGMGGEEREEGYLREN